MLIVGRHSIDRFLKVNAQARVPMERWFAIAGQTDLLWNDITEARQTFPTADLVKGSGLTCFNIGGNSYRLLTIVAYSRHEVVIHELMTHTEYSKRYA